MYRKYGMSRVQGRTRSVSQEVQPAPGESPLDSLSRNSPLLLK